MPGVWTSRPNLPAGRSLHGGAGNSLLAVLAVCGSPSVSPQDAQSTTYHFNGASWITEANTNVARAYCSSAGEINNAMLSGGTALGNLLPSAETYNGVVWSVIATPVSVHTAPVVLGTPSTAQLVGGYDNTNSSINITERYNSISWAISASLTVKRGAPFGAGIATFHRIVGGLVATASSAVYLSSSETYDGVSYSSSVAMVQGQFSGGSSQQGVQSSLVIFGGIDSGSASITSAVEIFVGTTWASDSPLLTARRYPGGSGTGQAAFATGGQSASSNTSLISTESFSSGGLGFPVAFGQATVVVKNPGRTNVYGQALAQLKAFRQLGFGSATGLVTGKTKLGLGSALATISVAYPAGSPTWTAQINSSAGHYRSGSSGNKLNATLAGGSDGGGNLTSTVETWNSVAWATVASMVVARRTTIAVGTAKDNIVIAGATGQFSDILPIASVEKYNGVLWTTLGGSLPFVQNSMGACGTSSSALVAGGHQTPTNATILFDGVTWAQGSNLNGANALRCAAAGTPNSCIVVGTDSARQAERLSFGVWSVIPSILDSDAGAGDAAGAASETDLTHVIFWHDNTTSSANATVFIFDGVAWGVDSKLGVSTGGGGGTSGNGTNLGAFANYNTSFLTRNAAAGRTYIGGQGQGLAIINSKLQAGQAIAQIKGYLTATGQAQAYIATQLKAFGAAQALIFSGPKPTGQSVAWVKTVGVNAFGQATAQNTGYNQGFGQALALLNAHFAIGNAVASIAAFGVQGFGNAIAIINQRPQTGQAIATIRATSQAFGQANASIVSVDYVLMAASVVGTFTDYIRLAANVQVLNSFDYVNLAANVQKISTMQSGQASTLVSIQLTDYVQLAATVVATGTEFINLAANVSIQATDYVRLLASVVVFNGGFAQSLALIQATATDYVQLLATVQAQGFDYVRLAANVRPFGQATPGDGGMVQPVGSNNIVEDFLSCTIADSAYSAYSKIILDGCPLVVTSFRPNVLSFQTRARPWLNLQDVSSGGSYTTTAVREIHNADDSVDTITTATLNEPNKVTITETRVNSGTPTRTDVKVTVTNKSGKEAVTEKTIVLANGVAHTSEKKTVSAVQPTKTNRQPIKLKTLDGVEHFQWYGQPNPDWTAGDAFGTTDTETDEQTIINGDGTVTKSSHQVVSLPDGQITDTLTVTTGLDPNLGQTVKETSSEFSGTSIKKVEKTTLPNGQTRIVETDTNFNGDDSTAVETLTETDPFGQVTTTTTTTESVRTPTGVTTTVTQAVTKGGVTTTTKTISTDNNYEDAVADKKVQVFLINEFAITAIMDEATMKRFFDIAKQHQMSYALQELYNQKLSGNRLSYSFRKDLTGKYDNAIAMLAPKRLTAFSQDYDVVFAASSSAFVPEYLNVEPHIYRVQLVLQERKDLTTSQ